MPSLQIISPTPVRIPVRGSLLPGALAVPPDPVGVVIFAHGSGSSRLSPRNRAVAEHLHTAGLGTLLFDLLTPAEEEVRANVFDLPLLAERLIAATEWLDQDPTAPRTPIGYFGASTGAGAALIAAARLGPRIRAVVSRGGRPDLAHDWLPRVRAATLLIVGGLDTAVIGLNRLALADLQCEKQLTIVPGATHLFEEPGTMEQVSRLAEQWFVRHLGDRPRA